MKYDDNRKQRVTDLLDKLIEEARRIDRNDPNAYAIASVHGLIKYYVPMMFAELDDNHIYVNLLPQALEDMIEELGNEEVMKKLES